MSLSAQSIEDWHSGTACILRKDTEGCSVRQSLSDVRGMSREQHSERSKVRYDSCGFEGENRQDRVQHTL
jgi:hypothetical protein